MDSTLFFLSCCPYIAFPKCFRTFRGPANQLGKGAKQSPDLSSRHTFLPGSEVWFLSVVLKIKSRALCMLCMSVCLPLSVSSAHLSLQNRLGYEPQGPTRLCLPGTSNYNSLDPKPGCICFYFKCRHWRSNLNPCVSQVTYIYLSYLPSNYSRDKSSLSGPHWPGMLNLKGSSSLLSHHD